MKQPNDGQDLSGSVGDPSLENGQSELELLGTECARLREQVMRLEKERDDYRKAVYAYLLAEITDEDLERYAKIDEDGEPLEAFLPELERIIRGEKP